MTCDASGLLIWDLVRRFGFTKRFATHLHDTRESQYLKHGLMILVRQGLFAMAYSTRMPPIPSPMATSNSAFSMGTPWRSFTTHLLLVLDSEYGFLKGAVPRPTTPTPPRGPSNTQTVPKEA